MVRYGKALELTVDKANAKVTACTCSSSTFLAALTGSEVGLGVCSCSPHEELSSHHDVQPCGVESSISSIGLH